MAVPVKQPINFSFQQGLNLKTDPYQVQAGNFLSLVNSVFDKVGRLTKRNGFPNLTPLPNTSTSFLTTFNGDLQAIGPDLLALSENENKWLDKGSIHPISLSTLSLIRNSVNQSYADCAISPNGLILTAYAEESTSTTPIFKYAIADSITGQNVLEPTLLPNADSTYGTPRTYVVGNYFVILYTTHPAAYVLKYLVIPWNNTTVSPVTGTIAASYDQATTVAFDAVNMNNLLYIVYNGASASGIQMTTLSGLLAVGPTVAIDASHVGTVFTIAADTVNQLVWATYYDIGTTSGYTTAVNSSLITQLVPTQVISSGTILNLASVAQNTSLSFWYEVSNNYVYDSSIPTHFIDGNTCTLSGTVGTPFVAVRSVGLASKAFTVNGIPYFLSSYQSSFQATYFLIEGDSTTATPITVAKVAYGNGGGYLVTGLPNVSMLNSAFSIPYLIKDLVQAVNKNTAVPAGSQTNGIYTQTGINLVSFEFTTDTIASVEIGKNLNLTGGFLWGYDGYLPVENNFFLYPDNVEASWSATGGSIHAQPDNTTNTNAYWYQIVYAWTDNQGNTYRSAPSIPIPVTTTSNGTSGSITVHVPTLRLTYKVANKAKIEIYRYSVAQPIYYQVTSLTFSTNNPCVLNDTTTDSITFVDKLADASILGNNILYTTGGVVEDVSGPSSNILALFNDRLWLVDAEDPNLLWYSKQVIEGTPVEMSDLFTFFVPPSTGAQGSTGNITALFPMDDKLIIFKPNAIYYINGIGPDNTGANNNYSDPIFITSAVGCSNPRSIALIPEGLMFQSNKGIWLLGRNMQTLYIGAPIEDFNSINVVSATVIPGTNQVRFGLRTVGATDTSHVFYDYFVGQWGEFEGIPSVSGTLYQDKHTIVNKFGEVSQESVGTYLDGTNPVLMSFVSAWLQLAGLRGYMRAFWFSFLGTFLSPHKMNFSIAYDYDSSPSQSDLINPSLLSFGNAYGNDPYYGGNGSSTFGSRNLINYRVFLERQRCKAFQISMQEVFDPTYGTVAGPGLTLSGISCMVGLKSAYQPVSSQQQTG